MAEDDDDRLFLLPTFDEIRALSRDELVERINAMIAALQAESHRIHTWRGGATIASVRMEYLAREIVRREEAEQTKRMVSLTHFVAVLTIIVAVAAVPTMIAAVWPLAHAVCP